MEGRFVYSKGMLDKYDLKQIRGEKAKYNILSLSKTFTNMLMWSYYSEGHSGFVVGVRVVDSDIEIEPVDYVNDLRLDRNHNNLAKSILTKKLKLWSHEKEYRVLKQHDPFVKIKVEELIFSIHADTHKKELITAIAKKFCPDILVKQLTRDELETGEVEAYDI